MGWRRSGRRGLDFVRIGEVDVCIGLFEGCLLLALHMNEKMRILRKMSKIPRSRVLRHRMRQELP